MENKTKTIIDYDIPIVSQAQVDKFNRSHGTDYKSSLEHIGLLIDKLYDSIDEVGKAGGFYTGDRIKVKIELEYLPEDK